MNNRLYVAACYFNPNVSKNLLWLMNQFSDHMEKAKNVCLHMVELSYGQVEDQPYVDIISPYHVRKYFGTNSILFHKENLLNLAIKTFPDDWQYGAIVDADLHFNNPNWAEDTVKRLQVKPFIQPFDMYKQVSGQTQENRGIELEARTSFACHHIFGGKDTLSWSLENGPDTSINPYVPCGAAWAFRRDAYEAIGGFFDKSILGSGDRVLAEGLVGNITRELSRTYSQEYANAIVQHQEKVYNHVKGNIGYTPGTIVHYWHGSKNSRAYFRRNLILALHQYDPSTDTRYNSQGVLELTGNKSAFEKDIREHFAGRNEDAPYVPNVLSTPK